MKINGIDFDNTGLEEGALFYYADREQGKPIKCKVLDMHYSFPTKIIAENVETKQEVICYMGYGCYSLDEYEKALEDAKIQSDRIIY